MFTIYVSNVILSYNCRMFKKPKILFQLCFPEARSPRPTLQHHERVDAHAGGAPKDQSLQPDCRAIRPKFQGTI